MTTRFAPSRFLPALAVIAVAACIAGGLRFQFLRLRSNALASWEKRMDGSAEATRASVQLWLDERRQDSRLIARRAGTTPDIFASEDSDRVEAGDLFELITTITQERGHRDIWVVRRNGSLVVESGDADPLPDTLRSAGIQSALSGRTLTVGPLSDAEGEIFAVIEPVIKSERGKPSVNMGAVIVGIDPFESLFPIVLREQSGIETARHRLVAHVGNELVVLTPSRFPTAAAGTLRTPWSKAPLGGRLAIEGKDTTALWVGIDGTKVIGATRHIAETQWGIVRAIDSREAFDPVDREFHLDELLALSVSIAALVFVLALRRHQRTARAHAIAESESRYRLLAEHATDIIMRQNVDGEILYVSPACRLRLGYDATELLSADVLHLVHPDDVEIARQAHEVDFRNALSLPVQYRLRRSGGEYVWFEVRGQPVLDSQTRQLLEIITVSRDVSIRRAAEEEGMRLAQRNALLLKSAAEGIFGLDRDGLIIFTNPAAEELVGWSEAEMLGKSQHALVHHTRLGGTENRVDSCPVCLTASTERAQSSHDEVFWRRNGTSFPVEYQSTPIREGDQVVGAVVTFRDVSARRQANLELVRAKEEAEAANAAKSDFLARMSHELRTPLNSVIGFANVLRKNKSGNLGQQDLTYLERIGTNGVQLLALINDILDLSKIEAGKMSLDVSSVSIGDLVRETLAQLGDRGQKDNVQVGFSIPGVVGTIDTDSAKLRQVLINLVGNAVKFTHAGTVTVSVETDAITKRAARIKVSDTGIGIAPDRLAAVFAAFEQADTSTTREYGGTGLGLSISRALCELLGFRLNVESELGKGTTFTIELASMKPAASRPVSALMSSIGARIGLDELEENHSPLVLVIEDDADARELLRHHIQELGYRVALAGSGMEGLRLALELQPQLITLDLMMPGMDGWELLKRLVANPELAQIPVIIVSSIAGEMRESFVGAVDWIDKPFAHTLLQESIMRNIEQKQGGILLVEDDPDARELIKGYVSEELQGQLRIATDGTSALLMLQRHMPDLVLLDLKMPSLDGFAFLDSIRHDPRLSDLAVIVVTGMDLTVQQREQLSQQTIAILEKGATLEDNLARALRRARRVSPRNRSFASV